MCTICLSDPKSKLTTKMEASTNGGLLLCRWATWEFKRRKKNGQTAHAAPDNTLSIFCLVKPSPGLFFLCYINKILLHRKKEAGLIVPLGSMRVLVVEYGEYLADEVEQNKRHDEDSDGAKKPFFKCFQVVRDYREVVMHVAGKGQ